MLVHHAARMLLLGTLIGLLGCNDDLPKATSIVHMRVLGSQLSVIGDETRATPRPGEDVRITFATVFPDLDQNSDESQLMVLGCTAPDRFTGGVPICQEFIDAALSGDSAVVASVLSMPRKVHCSDIPGRRFTSQGVTVACVDGPPSVVLPIKESFTAARAMFIGVLCEKGRAFIDPETPGLFGCDDNDGETLALHSTYTVQQSDDDENHNPLATDLAVELPLEISLDGEWQAVDAINVIGLAEPYALDEDICTRLGQDPPHLPRGDIGSHVLTLRYPADAREELDGIAEPLEVSIHTTSGEVERRFTVWTDESETPGGILQDTLNWQPDKNPPEGGQLVRFFVTVRDQRGGFDMATYAMCVR